MVQADPKELKILRSWQSELFLFIVFVILCYWFTTSAIDSARTLEWTAAIISGLASLKYLGRLIKHLFRR